MKRLVFVVLIGLLGLCGCAHQYVMKLNNGTEIVTPSKPKLKGSAYHFKDANGKERVVSAGRVREVEPASMAREEKKAMMPHPPTKPKHWYFLWLAGGPVDASESSV
jgi:Bacterial protein of unknown function (DUF903)